MGLTAHHLKKFHESRIYTTVLVENLPQLAIQIWHFVIRDANKEETLNLIASLSSISSFVSIFAALIDVWSAKVSTEV